MFLFLFYSFERSTFCKCWQKAYNFNINRWFLCYRFVFKFLLLPNRIVFQLFTFFVYIHTKQKKKHKQELNPRIACIQIVYNMLRKRIFKWHDIQCKQNYQFFIYLIIFIKPFHYCDKNTNIFIKFDQTKILMFSFFLNWKP